MGKSLTVGDVSRDGMFQIVDTSWDSNGTLRVTVRERMGTGSWVGGVPIRRMRTLARRALPEYHKGQTRSSRVVRRFTADGCSYVTFAVSRNDS